MSGTPEAGRLQAELERVRGQVEGLIDEGRSFEQQHVYPTPRIYVSRLQAVYSGGGFDELFTGVDRIGLTTPAPGSIMEDSGFLTPGLTTADKTALPQRRYAQDVAVMVFNDHRIIVPTPNQLIPVIDSGAGGPWERLALFADITDDGAPSGIRTALPCMNANKPAQFFPLGGSGKYPYKTDNVYVAIHVWPFLDSVGASTITGVDPDDGFFIIWTPPPGETAETIEAAPSGAVVDDDSETVSDGDTVEVTVSVTPPTIEIDRDGQGNVIDLRMSDDGSVTVIVIATSP